MNKKLIVTADDFGLTEGVNRAIVRAYCCGIVTSASLMVNTPAFESAAELARENAGLGIGLHLNLTQGRSTSNASAIPSLADSHGFRYVHPLELAVAIARRRVRTIDLEWEIRAQMEAAFAADVQLKHIDGHKHVHVIPQVLSEVCRIGPMYGIKAVRSVAERTPGLTRLLVRNRRAAPQVFKQYLFGRTVSALWKLSWPAKSRTALVVPERFYGITQTGFLDFDAMANVIRELRSGVSELMCHPGYVDDELSKTQTRLRSQRERELELLTSREVRDLIEQSGVELISYKDLVEDYGSSDEGPVFHRCPAL